MITTPYSTMECWGVPVHKERIEVEDKQFIRGNHGASQGPRPRPCEHDTSTPRHLRPWTASYLIASYLIAALFCDRDRLDLVLFTSPTTTAGGLLWPRNFHPPRYHSISLPSDSYPYLTP